LDAQPPMAFPVAVLFLRPATECLRRALTPVRGEPTRPDTSDAELPDSDDDP